MIASMKHIKNIIFYCLSISLLSCTKTQEDFKSFDFKNTYSWSFPLMGDTQVSTHSFYADSIVYTMKGKAYHTKYCMQKVQFDSTNNKWIGKNEKGYYFTLFLNPINDTSISIYKHKSASLDEAKSITLPPSDTQKDHGWNTYIKTE